MSDTRVRRASEQLAKAAQKGDDWVTFVAAAHGVIGQFIAFDRCCWHSVDPGTVLFTGSFHQRVGCSGTWLAEHEYVIEDVNKWWFLAQSGRLAGATSIATYGDLSRSARNRSQATFGIGLGSLILTANVFLLSSYLLGCHSLRHLVGGSKKTLSDSPLQLSAWKCVSCLNQRHMRFAWFSLFSVGFADLYVRLCSMGIWDDWRIL